MPKKVGLLTAGSDCPGINAAIRGFGKAGIGVYGMQVLGFKDGFRGLVENHTLKLSGSILSGILTAGGTILGTSRDIPQAMMLDGALTDRTQAAIKNYQEHKLDALVCIGGKETQSAALHLQQAGLNVITLPKAADNDVPMTDLTIGFDTAREIAAQAIDRLHSTASANHRIIIVELMGAHSGWLTMGAGIAGGADVILIPEIPYDTDKIVQAILERNKAGKNFSIIAISENTRSKELVAFLERSKKMNEKLRQGKEQLEVKTQLERIEKRYSSETLLLASRLEEATNLETRITILSYLLRGGTPSATDRLLATQMAGVCARMVSEGKFGCMINYSAGKIGSVTLEKVVDKSKPMPLDHPWILSARQMGTSLGD